MRKFTDLSGQTFNALTVISRDYNYPGRTTKFLCKCVCGNIKSVDSWSLRTGNIKSCGCLRLSALSKHNTIHGEAKGHQNRTREYIIWSSILDRCYNTKHHSYKDYGGRGISMCDTWKNSYAEFLKSMGRCPENCSIDRIDNSGNYEPGNCRWATQKEQCNNKRSNRTIVFNGISKTLAQWADEYNMIPETISLRLKLGWTIEKALCQPVRTRWKRNIAHSNIASQE